MSDVNQTLTVVTGTDGRVKVHAGSPIIIAGVTKWTRSGKATVVRFPHFESGADVQTSTVQAGVKKGLGENSVALEGWINTNTTDQTETGTTGITNGAYVALDLLVSRTLGKGYSNVVGYISNFQIGSEIEKGVSSWTATLEVDGVFPTYGTVT